MLRTQAARGRPTLRDMHARGADARRPAGDASRSICAAIHRILCIHLGTPPEHFTWQWRDKDGAFHRDRGDDAAASSRRSSSSCRWTSTSAWSTTRGRPARSGGPSRCEYLGNVVGGERGQLPERRDGADEARSRSGRSRRASRSGSAATSASRCAATWASEDSDLFDYERAVRHDVRPGQGGAAASTARRR